MTRYTRVRFRPRGQFHFGGRGVGMERSDVWLPADSLFSALCTVLADQHGADIVEELLAEFRGARTPSDAPFRLTSLMPYAADVSFLPYPMVGPPRIPNATDLRRRKQFKAVQWVSSNVFRALARHESPTAALENDLPTTIHGGKIWLTLKEKDGLESFMARHPETGKPQSPVLWRTHLRPRVTVDRKTLKSAVYALGGTAFNRTKDSSAGLYTVVEWLAADESVQALIKGAFEQLGEVGIGGKRSSGFGQFVPNFEDFVNWSIGASDGDFFTTFSPYHPRPNEREVIGPEARYEIELRRGWLSLSGYMNLRRASIRMIADGSVLRWPSTVTPFGDLVDVTPKTLFENEGPTVYRYGLVFPVRIANAAMKPSDQIETRRQLDGGRS
ncbi:MAG: type III-A CRISPR-associated RAMP protein Csm4 [Chloroflexota bacterium]|nr:type III-A CRISPR-associated RAMP protein Csm4 [Chloroflexota bacterium]